MRVTLMLILRHNSKSIFPVKEQSEVGLQEEIAAVKKEQTIRKKLFFSDRQEKFEKAIRK